MGYHWLTSSGLLIETCLVCVCLADVRTGGRTLAHAAPSEKSASEAHIMICWAPCPRRQEAIMREESTCWAPTGRPTASWPLYPRLNEEVNPTILFAFRQKTQGVVCMSCQKDRLIQCGFSLLSLLYMANPLIWHGSHTDKLYHEHSYPWGIKKEI